MGDKNSLLRVRSVDETVLGVKANFCQQKFLFRPKLLTALKLLLRASELDSVYKSDDIFFLEIITHIPK